MAQKVDLNEIQNIPEDEFKRNLLDWIEQMDITKELQSKLRSDLFQNFGKTALGRQIAVQYQQSQRIVLSPLVLVINTLVAEFLYAQNCHFSLSVFNSEVPYKNTLPDFERNHKFRFDSSELEEIIKALGMDHSEIYKSEIVQTYKTPHERDGVLIDASLLFCIMKTLSSAVSGERIHKDVKLSQHPLEVDDKCNQCKNIPKKPKNDELHSKYYKHFYKYLELLSQHVVEISENTKKFKESTKSEDQNSLKARQLNKRLDKITESLKNLSKSNRKGRKVTEIIKSVTRLTNEVERCSGNVAKYSSALKQSSKDVSKGVKAPSNYTEWLSQMTESTFGQRFIRNLEIAQEKAITNEVQRIKGIYNEKFQTTRMLIKLHYKQKTLEKFRSTMQSSPVIQSRRNDFNELVDEKLRLLKEKENYWKQTLASTPVKMPSTDNVIPSTSVEAFNDRVTEPEANMHEPVLPANSCRIESQTQTQTPRKGRKHINIEIFDEPLRPIEPVIDNMVQVAKNRLLELENESEQLDKSFQIYLKNQNEQKQLLADDVANVWKQYERAKDNMFKTFVVPKQKTTSATPHFNETVIPIPTEDPIVPLMKNKTKLFENPYKKLHASLTMTGLPMRADSAISKKEIAIQANGSVPRLTVQQSEATSSADKVSQIPIPMKIKSIMKKPMENGSKTHLKITKSPSNDHHVSDPSDASSYLNVKNASHSDALHLGDTKPSDMSAKSKQSENSLNSIESNLSERSKNENALTKNTNFVQSKVSANVIASQTGSASKDAERYEMTQLFRKIELKDRLTLVNTNSSSSESYEKMNISTGRKSTSSDDFWK